MAPGSRTSWTIIAGGSVPVLAGVLLLLLAPSPYGSVGWFAYAPLQAAGPPGSVVVLGPQQCLGLAAVALGLVVLVATAGHRAGRSQTSGR